MNDMVYSLPAPRSLLGDEDVDIGLHAVPDVIDELDLVPDVIQVQVIAVDENPGCGLLELVDVLSGVFFRAGGFGSGKGGKNDEGEE